MTKFQYMLDEDCDYIPDANDSNLLYENMPMEEYARVRNAQERHLTDGSKTQINWMQNPMYGISYPTDEQRLSEQQRLRSLQEQQEIARLTHQRAMFERARFADEFNIFRTRIIG